MVHAWLFLVCPKDHVSAIRLTCVVHDRIEVASTDHRDLVYKIDYLVQSFLLYDIIILKPSTMFYVTM